MASEKSQRPPEVDDRLRLVTRYMQNTCARVEARLAELVAEARLLEKIGREIAEKGLDCYLPDQPVAVREFMEYTAAAIGHCQDVLARIDGQRREVLVVKVPVPVNVLPEPSTN